MKHFMLWDDQQEVLLKSALDTTYVIQEHVDQPERVTRYCLTCHCDISRLGAYQRMMTE